MIKQCVIRLYPYGSNGANDSLAALGEKLSQGWVVKHITTMFCSEYEHRQRQGADYILEKEVTE